MLPYGRQWITEEDVAAVTEALQDDCVTQGKRVPLFEEALCKGTRAPHAIAVANGTAALHIACAALPITLGITTPITFLASANCLLYVGAGVHFADVDPKTGLLDPNSVEATLRRVSSKGQKGVVISVSLNGAVADLPAIETLAKRHDWFTLEDAAHSLGATYTANRESHSSASCRHSDLAILSFHPLKHICTGEGGAVTTRDSGLADTLRLLRSHGINKNFPPGQHPGWYTEQVRLGWNYRLTDIQAALGTSQMRRLPHFLERRRQLAARYRTLLAGTPFTQVFDLIPEISGNAYHLFAVHFKDAKTRDAAYAYLKEQGIQTQVNYRPVYAHPYYRERFGAITLPGAEAYARGCLSLPLFPKMSDADQDRVCERLHAFCTR